MQQEVHGSRKSPADTAGPESITQRKGAFIKAAHQYGQLYEWRKARDQCFTEKEFRLATRDLLRATRRLTEQTLNDSAQAHERVKNGNPQLPIERILGTGHGYRRGPNQPTNRRELALAVNWHLSVADDEKPLTRRGK